MGAYDGSGSLVDQKGNDKEIKQKNEGGDAIALSLGTSFLQAQFLKALLAQTVMDKVMWQQTESYFQTPHGVYAETWETTISGVLITLRYFESMEIGGRLFKKGLKRGNKHVDIDLAHPAINYGLNFFEVRASVLQLYAAIKEQHGREMRKQHKKWAEANHTLDASGIGNLLISLINAFGMETLLA